MTPQITTEIVEVLRQAHEALCWAANDIDGEVLSEDTYAAKAAASVQLLLSRLEAKGRGEEVRGERLALERDLDAVNSELADSKAALAASDKRVAELEAEVARKDEALAFYADPLANGADGLPDFYTEMCFGERAQAALAPRNDTGGKEEKA